MKSACASLLVLVAFPALTQAERKSAIDRSDLLQVETKRPVHNADIPGEPSAVGARRFSAPGSRGFEFRPLVRGTERLSRPTRHAQRAAAPGCSADPPAMPNLYEGNSGASSVLRATPRSTGIGLDDLYRLFLQALSLWAGDSWRDSHLLIGRRIRPSTDASAQPAHLLESACMPVIFAG